MALHDIVAWQNLNEITPSNYFPTEKRQWLNKLGINKYYFYVSGDKWFITNMGQIIAEADISSVESVEMNLPQKWDEGFVQIRIWNLDGSIGILDVCHKKFSDEVEFKRLKSNLIPNVVSDEDLVPHQVDTNLSATYEGGSGTGLQEKIKGQLLISSAGLKFESRKGLFTRGFEDLQNISIDGHGYYQVGGNMQGFGTTAFLLLRSNQDLKKQTVSLIC